MKVPLDTFLLAKAVDQTAIICWMLSEDGRNGTNKPELITASMIENTSTTTGQFATPGEFEAFRASLAGEGGDNGERD